MGATVHKALLFIPEKMNPVGRPSGSVRPPAPAPRYPWQHQLRMHQLRQPPLRMPVRPGGCLFGLSADACGMPSGTFRPPAPVLGYPRPRQPPHGSVRGWFTRDSAAAVPRPSSSGISCQRSGQRSHLNSQHQLRMPEILAQVQLEDPPAEHVISHQKFSPIDIPVPEQDAEHMEGDKYQVYI